MSYKSLSLRGQNTGTRLAASLVCYLTCQTPAFATEGGFYSGPIGGTDFGSALMAAPKTFSIGTSVNPQWDNIITGYKGGQSPGIESSKYRAVGLGAAVSYVYPWTLFNGRFQSSIQDQYIFLQLNENTKRYANSGFNDPYVDVLAYGFYAGQVGAGAPKTPSDNKMRYGLFVRPSFSVTLPLGRYNSRQILNEGHNAWIFVPNISFTYIAAPLIGTRGSSEFSTRIYYEKSADNPRTGYRNGDIFVDDFAFSQRLGNWQYGFAGTVADQIGDDTRHGDVVAIGGHRLFDFTIGPVLSLAVPKWHAVFGIKAYYDAVSQYRVEHNSVLIRAAFSM